MTQRTNPHTNAEGEAREAVRYSYLTSGRVSSAPQTQGSGLHHVNVQESGAPSDRALPVLPTVHGDYYVPPTGAPVMVAAGERDQYYVLSAAVPNVDTTDYKPGERILSHPLSEANVRFNDDGSIDIHGDTTVRINNGSQGAITDIETSSDSDGHITDISLVRNNNILL